MSALLDELAARSRPAGYHQADDPHGEYLSSALAKSELVVEIQYADFNALLSCCSELADDPVEQLLQGCHPG